MDSKTLSVKLWPPSKITRLLLVQKMTKRLINPSILYRDCGLFSKEEAEEDAENIEAGAFAFADETHQIFFDDSYAAEVYAKRSHILMLKVFEREIDKKNRGILVYEKVEDASSGTVFDISGRGPRYFIEAEKAKELLKPLGEPGNKFNKIRFSNGSFGLDAARIAGPILSSIKDQLTEVDLSDFVAARPEDEALEVMAIFSSALVGCRLRYLNLSSNALGEKGVRAFSRLLKSQHNLEELYLKSDDISDEAARAVRELIPSTDKLRVLHFHNCMTGDEGGIAISELVKESSLLEDFRCSYTIVNAKGGIALAEALRSCARLKKLDLRGNMFMEVGIALSKTLPIFSDLTEIYLGYSNLGYEGSKAVADALKDSAPSLQVLDMAGNGLADEGAIIVAKALEEGHDQLTEVDMSNNAIRIVGARWLALAVLNKPKLKLLNIDINYISGKGIDELKEIFEDSPTVLLPLGNSLFCDDDIEEDLKGRDIEEDFNRKCSLELIDN